MKNYLLAALLLLCLSVFGQGAAKICRDKRTAGSAYILEGKILQVNVFVSISSDEAWTPSEKNDLLQALPESEHWLKKQLGRFNKEVDFKYKNYGLKKDIVIPTVPNDEIDPLWNRKILKQMGYSSPLAFYDQLKEEHDFDQMYIVFFINGEDVSFANLTDVGYLKEDEESFVECIAMFNHFEGKHILDQSERYTIPHEILHLFGALDLYEGPDQSESTEKLAIERLNKSLMLGSVRFLDEDLEQWPLSNYEIDEFTAYILNLNGEHKKWYDKLAQKCEATYK